MKKLRMFILCAAVVGMFLATAYPAMAAYYDVCGKQVAVEGFIRQEFGFNTNSSSEYKTNQTGLQSAYMMAYLDTHLELGRSWDVRGIYRLWGDWIYAIRGDHGHFERYFESSRKNLQIDDSFDQILREFYVSYYGDKFMVRAGKQQIGWGEADGLRLMDVINPLDARREFLFYDTEGYEEARIPKWMLKTEFYTGSFGPILDTSVELYWNPGDVKETGELLPTFAEVHRAGGLFQPGLWPMGSQKQWGVWGVPQNFVPLPVQFYKKERATALKNSEYGARIKLNYWNTFITLNYWQGFQQDCVLDFGGFIIPHPAGWAGPPLNLGVPAALRMDREFKRMRVLGFTVNRELYGVGALCNQVANPVLRIEALYEFEKFFNTGNTPLPFDALVLRKYDQIRYMIGFDWSMKWKWINPGKNVFVSGQFFHQHTLKYRGGLDAPRPVPLYTWTYPKNQFYSSLLLRTEYFNERVVPSILTVYDHHCQAMWMKSKVDFKVGDHWRPQIGYLWIKRHNNHTQTIAGPGTPTISDNWKSFGIFEDRDQVWVRIQYQF
ncbi:MAG: hypothetical protein JXD19_07640 [Deltaproteobacteria bacterium]|nr:hypothetical protein [Deltaproteobacteria bacterium]